MRNTTATYEQAIAEMRDMFDRQEVIESMDVRQAHEAVGAFIATLFERGEDEVYRDFMGIRL